mmetsp:Transcript_34638/g.78316  ORF Transcript_34638/g.78316 Transcript_34638/m.78316 type:complete len:225 (+) Transcript_34638:929-1603(+)
MAQVREMWSVAPGGAPKEKIVGMENDRIPTKSMVTLMSAAPPENSCSNLEMPPAKKDMPRTSRRFERMDPRRLFLTISSRPALMALMVMIISTALPNVALRSPPVVSLRFSARCSVASPRSLARGTRPKKHRQNTIAPLYSYIEASTPRGPKMASRLTGSISIFLRILPLLMWCCIAGPWMGPKDFFSASEMVRATCFILSFRTAFSSGNARLRSPTLWLPTNS